MLNKNLFLIILISSLTHSQDSTDVNQIWNISPSGYFQVMTSTILSSFEMPFSKAIVHGTYGKQILFHLELRPTTDDPLVKAYVGYTFNPLLNVLLGQLSNPIKWIEPEPEVKEFIYYALYQHYVSNGDDIGIAVYGKNNRFLYYSCIINGTGRNSSDNNSAKDIVVYASYTMFPFLQVEAAGQMGRQPEGNRNVGFAGITLTPLTNLRLHAAAIGRTDLDDWGWYTTGEYYIDESSILCRLHQSSEAYKPEWTIGFQTGDAPLKLQLNYIAGVARLPEIAAVVQVYIK